jgi:hypothetical protein
MVRRTDKRRRCFGTTVGLSFCQLIFVDQNHQFRPDRDFDNPGLRERRPPGVKHFFSGSGFCQNTDSDFRGSTRYKHLFPEIGCEVLSGERELPVRYPQVCRPFRFIRGAHWHEGRPDSREGVLDVRPSLSDLSPHSRLGFRSQLRAQDDWGAQSKQQHDDGTSRAFTSAAQNARVCAREPWRRLESGFHVQEIRLETIGLSQSLTRGQGGDSDQDIAWSQYCLQTSQPRSKLTTAARSPPGRRRAPSHPRGMAARRIRRRHLQAPSR